MHAPENGNELITVKDASDRDVVHLLLVVRLVKLEVLNNPKTTVVLIPVRFLD